MVLRVGQGVRVPFFFQQFYFVILSLFVFFCMVRNRPLCMLLGVGPKGCPTQPFSPSCAEGTSPSSPAPFPLPTRPPLWHPPPPLLWRWTAQLDGRGWKVLTNCLLCCLCLGALLLQSVNFLLRKVTLPSPGRGMCFLLLSLFSGFFFYSWQDPRLRGKKIFYHLPCHIWAVPMLRQIFQKNGWEVSNQIFLEAFVEAKLFSGA